MESSSKKKGGGDGLDALRQRAWRSIKMDGQVPDAVKGMTGTMSERSPDICGWGCRVLQNVAHSSTGDVPHLVEIGGYDALLRVAELHPTSQILYKDLSGALAYMAAHPDVARRFGDAEVAILTRCFDTFVDSRHIQEHAILGVHNFASQDANKDRLGEAGLVVRVVSSGLKNASSPLPHLLLAALHCTATAIDHHQPNLEAVSENSGLELCAECIAQHTDSAPVITAVFDVLEKLAILDDVQARIREAALLPLIVNALVSNALSHASLAVTGCKLIARLATDEENRLQLLALDVVPLISDIFRRHKDTPDAVLFACWAIIELAVSNELELDDDEDVHEILDADDVDNAELDDPENPNPYAHMRGDSASEEIAQQDNVKSNEPVNQSGSREKQIKESEDDADGSDGSEVVAAAEDLLADEERINQCFRDVTDSILKNMKKHKDTSTIQQYGAKAIENLASRSEDLRIHVAKKNGVQIVLGGVRAHKANPDVVGNGFHALAVLASADEKMHVHMYLMKVISVCTVTNKEQPKSELVAQYSFHLLANLSLTAEVREKMLEKGVVELCISSILRHQKSVGVLFYGFKLLENMSVEAPAREYMHTNGQIFPVCVAAMEHFCEDVDVLLAAIRFVAKLALKPNGKVLTLPGAVAQILKVVSSRHEEVSRDIELVQLALTALNNLLLNPNNRQAVIDESGHFVLLRQLEKWQHEDKILKYACGNLSSLGFKSDKIRQRLLADGVAEKICKLIGKKMDNPAVIVPALATLRNLASHIRSHRKAVSDAGALSVLKSVLEAHPQNEAIVYWAMATANNISKEPGIKREMGRLGWVSLCEELLPLYDEKGSTYQAAYELWNRLPKPKRKKGDPEFTAPPPRDSIHELNSSELYQFLAELAEGEEAPPAL